MDLILLMLVAVGLNIIDIYIMIEILITVSYTHLDVYKRQV